MKGTERLLLLYINSEQTEREITTSYRDMLKELAFKNKETSLLPPITSAGDAGCFPLSLSHRNGKTLEVASNW